MTAQAHPSVLFRRAIAARSVALALGAAHEMGRLDLAEALSLTLLLGDREPRRYGRAAARWLGRYSTERRRVELADVQLLVALLAAYPDRPDASSGALAALFDERGDRDLAEVVTRSRVERAPTL